MIPEISVGKLYSRKTLWNLVRPGEGFPKGGSWLTGYVREGSSLLIFANLGVPGKTGHDFPNQYDAEAELMTWYGKPDAHSEQPTFRDLFSGRLTPFVFVRWTTKSPDFTYLGMPSISGFDDGVQVMNEAKTVRVTFSFSPSAEEVSWVGPAGLPSGGVEGGKFSVKVNRYERNPRLRRACIDHYGCACQVCGFNFEERYGILGKDFCHVHHLKPLSEMDGEGEVNPIQDLIPVCANCHAMLHSKAPAITPDELGSIMGNQHSPKLH